MSSAFVSVFYLAFEMCNMYKLKVYSKYMVFFPIFLHFFINFNSAFYLRKKLYGECNVFIFFFKHRLADAWTHLSRLQKVTRSAAECRAQSVFQSDSWERPSFSPMFFTTLFALCIYLYEIYKIILFKIKIKIVFCSIKYRFLKWKTVKLIKKCRDIGKNTMYFE